MRKKGLRTTYIGGRPRLMNNGTNPEGSPHRIGGPRIGGPRIGGLKPVSGKMAVKPSSALASPSIYSLSQSYFE